MGIVLQLSTGTRIVLKSHNRIGRLRDADVVVSNPSTSQNHASIRWSSQGWELLDLGSRNGTAVNHERVIAGTPVRLRAGMVLGFGNAEDLWRVESDAPPLPAAIAVDTGVHLVAQHGLICLEDPSGCVATVYRHPVSAEWLLEQDGRLASVRDGEVVQVGVQSWQMLLPTESATTEIASEERSIEAASFIFRTHREARDVWVTASIGRSLIDLGSHAHHVTLLALAQARLRDGQNPALVAAEHGWVRAAALAEQLGTDVSRINVDIYRARRQLAKADVAHAERLIERRPLAHLLRLGISRFAIDQR